MKRRVCWRSAAALAAMCLALWSGQATADAPLRPNIVYILCDDLGYGDVKCLNPEGKIATPNIDRLAGEGMRFTEAHSGSAVCTPTRYGIMTGRYAWRTPLQNGVLGGLSPRLIEPGRLTVAALLKQHGYQTACIGKWHLGMDWKVLPGKKVSSLSIETPDQVWNVDYSQPIANGPNAVGFDYYYGISASLDMVPYTFIENDRVTVVPTVDKQFPMMLGRGPAQTRKGPAAPAFDAADVLPTLTRKAIEFISNQAANARQGRPFFLYLPLASPHTPIVPIAQWQGKSELNPYADFVMQTDDAIGQVMAALAKHELAASTLFIVASDNGCSPAAKIEELIAKDHHPSAERRGHKADIFDGGHRIPFIARWPAHVPAGKQSDQLVCLTDLMATCADMLQAKLADMAGEDSVSILPALLGKDDRPLREAVVHHSINGSFAIREGKWKMALCPDSGGWSEPRPGKNAESKLPPVQLYDMTADAGEHRNLAGEHSDEVERLTRLMRRYVDEGRSTPGSAQANTGTINLWKSAPAARPAAERPAEPRR